MKDNKSGITPLLELCPICAKGAKDLDPKTKVKIIWTKPCEDCKDLMSKGFVLIGAVEDKTTDATNPYRSGDLWVVTKEVAIDLFGPNPPASGVAFIDIKVAAQMKH